MAAHERAVEVAEPKTFAPYIVEDSAGQLTGNVMANKRYGCPSSHVIRSEMEGQTRCCLRFWRVYDVRRHLKADHDLDLEDAELRQLLDNLEPDAAGAAHHD